MKKYVLHLMGVALIACLCISPQAIAQVTNGDFETQYPGIVPSQEHNVLGKYTGYSVDELPTWSTVGRTAATFLATNATNPVVNPHGTPYGGAFDPHSGGGAVEILREPGASALDSYITQQVTLIANHTYRASFYALCRSGMNQPQQLALSVRTAPALNAVTPAAYANIVSSPIANTKNWTLVTGTFVASANTNYIVVGFDPTTYPSYANTTDADYYAIDDVEIKEISPCDLDLSPYHPRNFCTNQGSREFGIRFPSTGFTFYWEFYSVATNGSLRLTRTATSSSASPNVYMAGIRFPAGYYTYRVRGYNNASGCYTPWQGLYSDTYLGTFTVEENCDYDPYQDGNRTAVNPTVEYEMNSAPTTAYPNPAAESITIPARAEKAVLLNAKGKTLQRADASGKLDVHTLPDGLYNLQMQQDGKLINQRIQVKH